MLPKAQPFAKLNGKSLLIFILLFIFLAPTCCNPLLPPAPGSCGGGQLFVFVALGYSCIILFCLKPGACEPETLTIYVPVPASNLSRTNLRIYELPSPPPLWK